MIRQMLEAGNKEKGEQEGREETGTARASLAEESPEGGERAIL